MCASRQWARFWDYGFVLLMSQYFCLMILETTIFFSLKGEPTNIKLILVKNRSNSFFYQLLIINFLPPTVMFQRCYFFLAERVPAVGRPVPVARAPIKPHDLQPEGNGCGRRRFGSKCIDTDFFGLKLLTEYFKQNPLSRAQTLCNTPLLRTQCVQTTSSSYSIIVLIVAVVVHFFSISFPSSSSSPPASS